MTIGSLIEREVELDVLSAAVARGSGVVVVEACAGLGKTALLDHGVVLAREAGYLVRRAAPGPLERHFASGVIRGLELESSTPHDVLRRCAALAAQRPLALVVDDAQWADRSSLEVLVYLAGRVDDVPLVILVAARTGDPGAESDLLTLLGAARAATVLSPAPLTARGTLRLLRQLAPATPAAEGLAYHRETRGNPWLLEMAIDAAPPRTGVRRRLAELLARDRAVAEALAVIGDDAPPHVVAAASGVPVGELRPARDALAAAGLFAEDRFAHRLIAAGIARDLVASERARLHRDAARALIAARADSRLAAVHLLECDPQADPAASACLQEAARLAPPQTAVAYLERALAEGAPGDDRGRLLARLGIVSYDAGLPDARRRLHEALLHARDRQSRIGVLTRLAALNLVDAADDGVEPAFERELERETDPDVRLAVEAVSLDALLGRHEERARRVAAVDLSRTADPLLERVILAHRAWVGVERGAPDAGAWAALALQAMEHDLLLGEAHWRAAYALCARVLVVTDNPAAGPAIAAMRSIAQERGSLRLRVAAEWYAADLALRTGRVAEAERLARLALDLMDSERNVLSDGVVEVLVRALAERGGFDEARELLRERDLDHARARLALAEGDFERAYAAAIRLGEQRLEQGRPNPSLLPWRSLAARALAHLGRRAEAARLADAELALAKRFGAPVPIAGALHARAVAEPAVAARIALCERGLTAAEGAPAGLEVIGLQLELGAAQVSCGWRFDAREALRAALVAAENAGAVLLARRARRELAATGLRSRSAAHEGAEALTPRQRQICELAAAGKGNRAIAQELFLSIKTIETHLAAAYRKLGVANRGELAAELAA